MRPIIFKAWHKERKGWIDGFNMVGFSTGNCQEVTKLEPHIYRYSTEWKLSEVELVQFTGLYDGTRWTDLSEEDQALWLKHRGKEEDFKGYQIFEGHIVEAIDGTGYRFGKVGVVVYEEDYGGFAVVGEYSKNQHHNLLNCDVACEVKIIGNKFQNPDLLTHK